MTRTVIFLGAGASKALGLPLTKDIFPMLLERLTAGSSHAHPLFGGDQLDLDCLKHCLEHLLPGLMGFAATPEDRGNWRETLPVITDVLSALDYFLVSANSPGPAFTLPQLTRARSLVERAIFELVVRQEEADSLNMDNVPPAVNREWRRTSEVRAFLQRPPDYEGEVGRTVDWIMSLAPEPEDRVTLVSTNYDIEIEQEIFNRIGYSGVFRQVDFGMSVRDPDSGAVFGRPERARVALYKLHGSLNWLRCDVCDNLYVNPVGAIAYLSFLLGDDDRRRRRNDAWLNQLWEGGANQCHCGYRPLRHMIVAPSFVREVRDPILLEIWRNALEALRQADRWIIVGYSLPPEDVAIRSMLLRAYLGRDDGNRPAVEVIQRAKKEPEMSRYRLLFPSHDLVDGGLSSYIQARATAR